LLLEERPAGNRLHHVCQLSPKRWRCQRVPPLTADILRPVWKSRTARGNFERRNQGHFPEPIRSLNPEAHATPKPRQSSRHNLQYVLQWAVRVGGITVPRRIQSKTLNLGVA